MHHIDANKTIGEKVWWDLHKNAKSYFQQFFEATTAVWSLTSHLTNHPSKMNKTCGALLGKQGQTHKLRSSMNPYIWTLAQSTGAAEYTDCISAEGVRPLNVYPRYDTNKSYGEVPVMLELLDMRSTPSMPWLPDPLWSGVASPDGVLSMGQIELNCVLILNWIAKNRTILTFKLLTYAKLNCLKWNCFCMLNWIAWNRTVFYIETVFTLNWIFLIRTVWLNWKDWNRNVFDN